MPTYIINKNNIIFEVKNLDIESDYHLLSSCLARQAESLEDFAWQLKDEANYFLFSFINMTLNNEKTYSRKVFFIDVNSDKKIECKNSKGVVIDISGNVYDFISELVYAHPVTGNPYLSYVE